MGRQEAARMMVAWVLPFLRFFFSRPCYCFPVNPFLDYLTDALAIAQKGKGRDKSRPYKSHMYLSTRECHAQVMALPADSSQVHPSCRAVDAGAPGSLAQPPGRPSPG